MKISIGADHAGFALKVFLVDFFKKQGCFLLDRGAYDSEASDYPDFAKSVSMDVLEKKVDLGVLICGSGIGMSMTANRYIGVRAALCRDIQTARLAREHNNANVLCLAGRYLTSSDCLEIVKVFISSEFSQEERYRKRVEKIDQGE